MRNTGSKGNRENPALPLYRRAHRARGPQPLT